MNKNIRQVWTFPSDSNPNVSYQTLQYADGKVQTWRMFLFMWG